MTYSNYGNGNNDIASTNYDWGVYNSIYNPNTSSTDAPGTWRTPTASEWAYIINTRATCSGVRYAKARVNGVSGLIIVPDNWDVNIYALNRTNTPGASFSSNTITSSNWNILEAAGCAFLPTAGNRSGTNVYDVATSGFYWSSTYSGSENAYDMYFWSGDVNPNGINNRYFGRPVRLVKNI